MSARITDRFTVRGGRAVRRLSVLMPSARSYHRVADRRRDTISGGSTHMSMQEALTRDRIQQNLRHAERARLAHELAAVRRWQRLERRAGLARARHAQRVAAAVVAERGQ